VGDQEGLFFLRDERFFLARVLIGVSWLPDEEKVGIGHKEMTRR